MKSSWTWTLLSLACTPQETNCDKAVAVPLSVLTILTSCLCKVEMVLRNPKRGARCPSTNERCQPPLYWERKWRSNMWRRSNLCDNNEVQRREIEIPARTNTRQRNVDGIKLLVNASKSLLPWNEAPRCRCLTPL